MTSPQLTNREYAYFLVTGPGDHELVTERVGFAPSDAWNVGDVNPSTGRPRKFMGWELRSGLDDTSPLEQHIDRLLLVLGPRALALRELWVEYHLTIVCVGHYPSSGHGLHLNREVVRQAAQLGIAFDFDAYFHDVPSDG